MSVQSVGTRSLFTAGAALVVTGALTASTLDPPHQPTATTPITVAVPAVRLIAAPSPLELYPQVVQRTISNVGALAWEYAVVVPALAGALVTNPLGLLRSAGAVAPMLLLFSPLLGPGYALASISPLLSGVAAAGLSLKEIGDAVTKGDPADFVDALVDIPARVVDGFLNGGVPGVPFYSIGIFTPASGTGPSPLGLPGVIMQMVLSGAGIQFPDPYQPPWAPDPFSGQPTTSSAIPTHPPLNRPDAAIAVRKGTARGHVGTAAPAPRNITKPGVKSQHRAADRPTRKPSARG